MINYADVERKKQKPNFVSFQNFPANAVNNNLIVKKTNNVIIKNKSFNK